MLVKQVYTTIIIVLILILFIIHYKYKLVSNLRISSWNIEKFGENTFQSNKYDKNHFSYYDIFNVICNSIYCVF